MVGRLTDLKGGGILVGALRRGGSPGQAADSHGGGGWPGARGMEGRPRGRACVPHLPAGLARAADRVDARGGPARRAERLAGAVRTGGVEAGCVGLPAVAFAVGGIPDWLIPGKSGELAPGDPPTADGLALAIVRALADPTHLQRLRIGAWEVARTFRRAALGRTGTNPGRRAPRGRRRRLMLKALLRQAAPRWLWSRLRTWKMRRCWRTSRPTQRSTPTPGWA